MASIKEDIKRSFQQGDSLSRLILINIGVYVLYLILRIVGFLFNIDIAGIFTSFTALPSHLPTLATRPWTIITYMFLHQGFLHIFFNLLWLYFGGRIFMDYFGGRRLISTFLIGGLLGGLLYVIFYNVFPGFSDVVAVSNNRGASAGVMAVVVAVATYNPRFPVRLFFVVTVPLWGIAVGFILLDLIGLGDGQNAGGRIAHLGGAAFGFLMARAFRESGKDYTEGFSQFIENIANWFRPKPKMRTVYSNPSGKEKRRSQNAQKADNDQKKMDEILDKISRSGYDSLSKEEKDHLFKIGRD